MPFLGRVFASDLTAFWVIVLGLLSGPASCKPISSPLSSRLGGYGTRLSLFAWAHLLSLLASPPTYQHSLSSSREGQTTGTESLAQVPQTHAALVLEGGTRPFFQRGV